MQELMVDAEFNISLLGITEAEQGHLKAALAAQT